MPARLLQRRSPITAAVRQEIACAAVAFLAQRYGLGPDQAGRLALVPTVWLAGSSVLRGSFVNGRGHGQPVPHVLLRVPRGATARRSLYRRVTVGLTTPPGGLEMPIRSALALTLVHEYTHALQFGDYGVQVRRGEVETTRNEIRYLERHLPEHYARLVPVERRAPGGRRRHAAAASPPALPDAVVVSIGRWLRRLSGGL